MDADPDLGRECALNDLAVNGGSRQPGPGKDSFQTDDTVGFAHGCAASCWLFLTASETRQDSSCGAHKRVFRVAVLWRRTGGKRHRSNFEAPVSTEVDAE